MEVTTPPRQVRNFKGTHCGPYQGQHIIAKTVCLRGHLGLPYYVTALLAAHDKTPWSINRLAYRLFYVQDKYMQIRSVEAPHEYRDLFNCNSLGPRENHVQSEDYVTKGTNKGSSSITDRCKRIPRL
jgi:hypothetical protein